MPDDAIGRTDTAATSGATAPLKILHVGKFMPPSFGGMERALDSMARGIASRGHQVRVLVHAGDGATGAGTVEQHGMTVRREPYRIAVGTMPISAGYLDAYRRWSRWADIVHFHEPFPIASVAFNLLPKPRHVVVSWHSDIVRQRLLRPVAEIFQKRLCARADRIICSTGGLRDSSTVLAPWRDKCAVVGFGLDASALRAAAADAARIDTVRRRCGGRFALAVGRLVSYKGFDVLLRALVGNDLRVVIVGDGPMASELEQLRADLGLRDRVVFAGGLDDAELSAYYAACEFFVLPSTTRAETFGIVQIEAMACGKPVINTALPTGVPEVSLDGITGLTVPPGDPAALGDALVALWRDPALVARLGARARDRVDGRYELNAVALQLEALYRSVMRGDPAVVPSPSSSASATPISDRATIV
ncbi:MAG: glycosyltransferase [Proteobacteria bacterium]|nr:glycosyltransferase [Pseudomonadota bacterium]